MGVKQKEGGYTEMLCVIASVLDLNPASVRCFTVPDTISLKGLYDTCALVFGLNPKAVAIELDESRIPCTLMERLGGIDTENTGISSLFREGDVVHIKFRAPFADAFLTLRVEVADIRDDQRVASSGAVPVVTAAVGLNLPSDVFKTEEVCIRHRMATGRARSGYGMENGLANGLRFDFQKTDKKLRNLFSPETASPEVRTELGMPLSVLLRSLKVSELKQIWQEVAIYAYGNKSKEEYVLSLQGQMDEEWLQNLLERLPLGELWTLRSCAIGETDINGTENRQLTFLKLGLLVDIKSKGFYYASELLNVLDKLLGTEAETKMMMRSACRTALKACAVYYTVFTEEMYLRVLGVLWPETPRDMALKMLELELRQEKESVWYGLNRNQSSGWKIYNSAMIQAAESNRISAMNQYTEVSTYLPTREEIFYSASNGMTESETKLCLAVRKDAGLLFGDQRSLFLLLGKTRAGFSPDSVIKALKNSPGYWIYSSATLEVACATLVEYLPVLPVAQLGGFSRREAPREVLLYARKVKDRSRFSQSVEL